MFKTKARIFITLIVIVILFLVIAGLYPRDFGFEGNSSNVFGALEKSENNNHYYISFLENQGETKKVKLECTKAQYDLFAKEEVYHMTYRKNFFNSGKGKVTRVSKNPIYDGNNPIARVTKLSRPLSC